MSLGRKRILDTSEDTMKLTTVSTPDDIAAVARLAREIWTEHYVPIVGAAQIDYMLERFQSEAAIALQLAEGFAYFLLIRDGAPIGYAAVQPQPDGFLFLSKIYTLKSVRGTGAGKALLAHIQAFAAERGLDRIFLTVNRHNHAAIAWYQRQGFVITGTKCQDIGQGFVMDDHLMCLSPV